MESLSISLDECLFDSEAIENITFKLPSKVKKFNFSYGDNMIGDEQLKSLSKNINFDENVIEELGLDFSQNEFGDDGVVSLSQKISKFKQLK